MKVRVLVPNIALNLVLFRFTQFFTSGFHTWNPNSEDNSGDFHYIRRWFTIFLIRHNMYVFSSSVAIHIVAYNQHSQTRFDIRPWITPYDNILTWVCWFWAKPIRFNISFRYDYRRYTSININKPNTVTSYEVHIASVRL